MEAETTAREAVSIRQRFLPVGHWQTANARSALGEALLGLKQFDEAEPLLLSAYGDLARDEETPLVRLMDTVSRIILLYNAWGKPDEAAEWLAKMPTTAESVAAPTTAPGGTAATQPTTAPGH